MRNTLFIVCLLFVFSACKKDKFTTIPQIKFVNLTPDVASSDILITQKEFAPKLIFKITDAEGDFGSTSLDDSSMIYVKHLLTNNIDSFRFPNLQAATKKDFNAEITINLFDALECYSPGPARPRTDTIFYEFYVQDAKKNKSNIVRTEKPLYYRCL
ncbi:MAG TPA: hypothetical protein VLR49_00785 [Ferruginibacter sp.]|nr:hypothetical protein [Ferruginibacter sp.]